MFKLEYEFGDLEETEMSNNQSVEGDFKSNSSLPFSSQLLSTTGKPIQQENDRFGVNETNMHAEEPFVCHYCDAKFRIRGYLTRHIKKHAIEKAYTCPFYNIETSKELRCHHSGGFSRRDTYKTHLRTKHILYPKGIKPSDRSKSTGHCAQCGEFFSNLNNWVELHIESGDCTGLPLDYLRVVRHERSKSGKLKMIKTSTGHSRFISTAQSVVEPKVLLNKDALEAMAIVAHKAQKDNILSKYGNNKIMMDVKDFGSDSESETVNENSSNYNNTGNIEIRTTSNSNGNHVSTVNYNTPKYTILKSKKRSLNRVDKLILPFEQEQEQEQEQKQVQIRDQEQDQEQKQTQQQQQQLMEENDKPLDLSIFEFDHFTATQVSQMQKTTTVSSSDTLVPSFESASTTSSHTSMEILARNLSVGSKVPGERDESPEEAAESMLSFFANN